MSVTTTTSRSDIDHKLQPKRGQFMEPENYNSGGAIAGCASEARMVNRPTLKNRLEEAVREAESRLIDAQRAREIFNAHPELEELFNIMQQGRF